MTSFSAGTSSSTCSSSPAASSATCLSCACSAYAHSFYNSKDIPFLAMFMIALWLVHRAFRRDTLGAFLLCGVGVGLLVNLRVMGVVLFAAVLVLRALDLAFAGDMAERGRVLLTGGAFALAAMLTFYASLPALWTDPVGRFAEMVDVLSSRPIHLWSLFRGEWLYSANGPPWDYVPVWVLLLAAFGAFSLAWGGLRRRATSSATDRCASASCWRPCPWPRWRPSSFWRAT